MKEIREIIKAYDISVKTGKRSALATLVHLNGSSYRRPGARMLVTEDGEMTGAISGGCLEGDALRKAMLALTQQQSNLVTYDSSDEEDAVIGMQLGCQGIIQVLFEPLDPADHNNPIQLLKRVAALRQKSVLATLFLLEDKRSRQPGTCLLLEENGDISGTVIFPEIRDAIMEDMYEAMQRKTSLSREYIVKDVSVSVFFEFLKPAVSLVVMGAGNDTVPLMQIADVLGWDIRIADGRRTHATPQRFLGACQVVVSRPESVLQQIPVDDQTVFVLATHNYNYDIAVLKALLLRKVAYIGILGPKKRLEKMLDELKDSGMELSDGQLNTIYGPVGLEIGAETSEEIALSIVAEIKAVLSGKQGVSLRQKQDVIHPVATAFTEIKRVH